MSNDSGEHPMLPTITLCSSPLEHRPPLDQRTTRNPSDPDLLRRSVRRHRLRPAGQRQRAAAGSPGHPRRRRADVRDVPANPLPRPAPGPGQPPLHGRAAAGQLHLRPATGVGRHPRLGRASGHPHRRPAGAADALHRLRGGVHPHRQRRLAPHPRRHPRAVAGATGAVAGVPGGDAGR
ncbi:hypothetical protein D3C81_1069470 [compost metagenome]